MKKIIILLFLAVSLTVSAEVFKIPANVTAAIKKSASKQFPNDYTTQVFIVKIQLKSYKCVAFFPWDKRVTEDVRDKIMAKAYKQFGTKHDYKTMLFVMETQQKAYLKLL